MLLRAMATRRKVRKGEWTCSCASYPFPHRFGGGHCNGITIVVEQWERNFGTSEPCKDCLANAGTLCEVVSGGESVTVCEAYIEFVESNEIKVKKR
jgi:hypothetical protein